MRRIVRNSLWLSLTHYATPPFPQKSRSARLFGCKRPHDGSLSLPTFADCGQPQGLSLRYVVVCFVSFATAFGCLSLTMQLLLFRKNHARLACSVVNALTTARCRYQLLRIADNPCGCPYGSIYFSIRAKHSLLFTLLCPIGHLPFPTLFRIQLKSSGVLPRAAMGSAYAPFTVSYTHLTLPTKA